ncbi:MAG: ornithine carbamoyltransferase [Chloroflexi bacterium]|nr:ornithine carbamoyltransferase [Chloroflexota bacterium]|tara:strand:- start:4890 stop:5846 length:957 start_codon:yes stop_codon:yes gene_type:complete
MTNEISQQISKSRNLLSILDLSADEILGICNRGKEIKEKFNLGITPDTKPLKNKTIAILFEKPSLRTRVSFEVAIQRLGGSSIYLGPQEVGLGTRESISDITKVLSRYVDAIICRTFAHANLEEMVSNSSIPIINALSDLEHPCQTLADLLTILEHKGKLKDLTVSYIGDGNNVANSLALGILSSGSDFRIAHPENYGFQQKILEEINAIAKTTNRIFIQSNQRDEILSGSDIIYTDVWTSMGQENEHNKRLVAFKNFQINELSITHAGPNTLLMHPMPAHYNEEISEGLLEHPQSIVFDQAENRLHAQQALLEKIIV